MSQFGGGAERQILREQGSGILIVYPLLVLAWFPLPTINQGEVKDVTLGHAEIRTSQVLAPASVPAPVRVGSCPAKPCILEQAAWRDSARHLGTLQGVSCI